MYQDLLNKPGKPPFQSEQWCNIIQSCPISLDRVLDRFQHDSVTNELSERVGVAKISFSGKPIGKGVSCYSDWITAWDETVVAYTYIWPNRDQELTAYRRHISSLFHSFALVSHSRVIKYNRAVQTITVETWSFLLHQVKYYPQLDRYWLTSACPPRPSTMTKSSGPRNDPQLHARISTLGCVLMMPSSAPNNMYASTAPAVVTSEEVESAPRAKVKGKALLRGIHPRYMRDLLWEEDCYPVFQASADLSEDPLITTPMPLPPPHSSFHPEFLQGLDAHPELFNIVTPTDVDRFDYLLSDYPNHLIVASVVRVLHEGAWPWATLPSEFSRIHNIPYIGTQYGNHPDY